MESILIIAACGLVARKYFQYRESENRMNVLESNPGPTQSAERDNFTQSVEEEQIEEIENVRLGAAETPEIVEPDEYSHRSGSMNIADLVQTMVTKTDVDNKTEYSDVNMDDDSHFTSQFFPQDSRSTGHSVTQKPWMRAVETAYNNLPKTETLAEFPKAEDREDVYKLAISQKMREFEQSQAAFTVPRSSQKQYESPVEAIWTDTGEGRGFHPIKRYHSFVLSENQILDLPEGPRGNFAGAGKSNFNFDDNVDNQKRELTIDHFGVPVAVAFKVSMDPSFELTSNSTETYDTEKSHGIASRAPVETGRKSSQFTVAYEQDIDAFSSKKFSGLKSSKKISSDSSDSASNLKLKNSQLQVPLAVGATGGNRLGSIDKSSLVKAKSKVIGDSYNVDFKAGSRSSIRAPVIAASHTDTDEKLAESDSSSQVRGASLKLKAVDSSQIKEFSDNREDINANSRTTINFLPKSDSSLPAHLRIKPTASVGLSKVSINLKEKGLTSDNMILNGKTPGKSNITSSLPTESTKTGKTTLGSIMNNRMSNSSSLKLLKNPYMSPAAPRFKALTE